MASRQDRRAWRAEFKSLGVRQTSERERASVWSEEKCQEARRWLRKQEYRPHILGASIGLSGAVIGAVATLAAAFLAGGCFK
jgi:hypothetical protein